MRNYIADGPWIVKSGTEIVDVKGKLIASTDIIERSKRENIAHARLLSQSLAMLQCLKSLKSLSQVERDAVALVVADAEKGRRI